MTDFSEIVSFHFREVFTVNIQHFLSNMSEKDNKKIETICECKDIMIANALR